MGDCTPKHNQTKTNSDGPAWVHVNCALSSSEAYEEAAVIQKAEQKCKAAARLAEVSPLTPRTFI